MSIEITESVNVAQINESQVSKETINFIESHAEAAYKDTDESIGESMYYVEQLVGALITEAEGLGEESVELELNELYDVVHEYQYFTLLKV